MDLLKQTIEIKSKRVILVVLVFGEREDIRPRDSPLLGGGRGCIGRLGKRMGDLFVVELDEGYFLLPCLGRYLTGGTASLEDWMADDGVVG